MAKRAKATFSIDPIHTSIDIFGQEITQHVWSEKYRQPDEEHPHDSMQRVCKGVYKNDPEHFNEGFNAMKLALWVPGGRIHAGAGTERAVTLLNCYVDRTIEDSMVGIAEALKDAMLTQQQGGGIGMDFSTLRPSGAYLNRTGSTASGPLPFMDMWNAMCATIMSAGSRRGAMMATMRDDHPDLPAFIKAKREAGRLTNFNVSVLVSDALMDAITANEDWHLGFGVPKADGTHLGVVDREEGPWYIYEIIKARDLWEMIIRNTYEYSEPGVIFIDRVNDWNNLNYCEEIRCTNPCGEQPLPPNGACNLGAVNLARMVRDPFGPDASFDYGLLRKIVRVGVRFLDNVIDVANYPLAEQKQEEVDKRRIGLGITGLGNALAMLKLRYGSEESLQTTNAIMAQLRDAAYEASADLAEERGSFPLFKQSKWGHTSPVVDALPSRIKLKIGQHGIRNGVLLTIAPTGTTSLYMGNVSSGLEPVFLHTVKRKVRQSDNTYKEFEVHDYGMQVYLDVSRPGRLPKVHGAAEELPRYLVTHEDLTVKDHVRMQAVCQKYVDASVSKTINCPEEMSYEDFKLVYWDAYNTGCKGCTTYRPSAVRGSVLSAAIATDSAEQTKKILATRPDELRGTTYKVKWPSTDTSYYITINNDAAGDPFEMFIASTSSTYSDWTTALSLLISAIMRSGHDIAFVPEELQKVSSHYDQAWIDGKHYGSLVALVGDILKRHLKNGDSSGVDAVATKGTELTTLAPLSEPGRSVAIGSAGEHGRLHGMGLCPKCSTLAVIFLEGCSSCTNCGYSNCS